jgi:hypothetical protein
MKIKKIWLNANTVQNFMTKIENNFILAIKSYKNSYLRLNDSVIALNNPHTNPVELQKLKEKNSTFKKDTKDFYVICVLKYQTNLKMTI